VFRTEGVLVAVIIGALACLLFGVAALVAIVGRRRFGARVTEDVTTLFSHAGASVGSEQLSTRWDALPEPVRRYLRYAMH
jgi:hypothetical protein